MKKLIATIALITLLPGMVFAQASKKVVCDPIVTVAFGSVGAGYTTFTTLSKATTMFYIDNQTDQDILCSDDTTTSAGKWIVFAFSGLNDKLPESFRYASGVISCKRRSAAPTVGNVFIQACY